MSQLQVESHKESLSHYPVSPDVSYDPSLRGHFEKFRKASEIHLMTRALRKLASIEKNYEDLTLLSQLEYDEGNYTDCLKCVDLALEVRGRELKGLQSLYRLRGACLIQVGLLDQAEDSLYQALEYPGETDQVLVNLGTLDIQRKSWESATVSFREALSYNSKNDKAWVGLSLCHRFRGDHELAFGNLELALDISPKNETALGLLLAWYGDRKEVSVQHRLLSYLLAGGENENLWLAFIELSSRRGETNIAKMELERLRLTHPNFVPAYQKRV